jgi:hypothetical protein
MQPDAEGMDTIISAEVGMGSTLQAKVVPRPSDLLVYQMCVVSDTLKTAYPHSFRKACNNTYDKLSSCVEMRVICCALTMRLEER